MPLAGLANVPAIDRISAPEKKKPEASRPPRTFTVPNAPDGILEIFSDLRPGAGRGEK